MALIHLTSSSTGVRSSMSHVFVHFISHTDKKRGSVTPSTTHSYHPLRTGYPLCSSVVVVLSLIRTFTLHLSCTKERNPIFTGGSLHEQQALIGEIVIFSVVHLVV